MILRKKSILAALALIIVVIAVFSQSTGNGSVDSDAISQVTPSTSATEILSIASPGASSEPSASETASSASPKPKSTRVKASPTPKTSEQAICRVSARVSRRDGSNFVLVDLRNVYTYTKVWGTVKLKDLSLDISMDIQEDRKGKFEQKIADDIRDIPTVTIYSAENKSDSTLMCKTPPPPN